MNQNSLLQDLAMKERVLAPFENSPKSSAASNILNSRVRAQLNHALKVEKENRVSME